MDDYNELRKTERCLTMVLELFDVTQAIVNNYPEFYLGNSEVVLCEDVPSLDGLPFDIMMFKQRFLKCLEAI